MFKLAHISDVHLGPLPKLTFRELASKRITGFVNWHRNRRKHLFTDTLEKLLDDLETKSPDHLAITGDLVNLATGIEIRAAADWLEEVGDPEKNLSRSRQSRRLCLWRARQGHAGLVSLRAR